MNKKFFITVALTAGLFLSPALAHKAFSQNSPTGCPYLDSKGYTPKASSGCPALDIIRKGNAPGQPLTPEQKRLERAIQQNLRSADTLIRAAQAAGATDKEMDRLGRMTAGFMEAFLNIMEKSPNPVPMRPAPPAKPRPVPPPAPQQNWAAPAPGSPQGLIITAPDGSQWLVTPQAQPPMKPQRPRFQPPAQSEMAPTAPQSPAMPPRVAPRQAPEGFIIMEEDNMTSLPKWPTKDEYASLGMMKYAEMLDAQKKGASAARSGSPWASVRYVPEGYFVEEETSLPVWPTKDQYAAEGMMKYVEDLKAGNGSR